MDLRLEQLRGSLLQPSEPGLRRHYQVCIPPSVFRLYERLIDSDVEFLASARALSLGLSPGSLVTAM